MKTLEERVETAKQLHAARQSEVNEIARIILEDLTDGLIRSLDEYRRTLITRGLLSVEEDKAWWSLNTKRDESYHENHTRLREMLPELYLR